MSARVHFPVPWSKGPDTSFLLRPDELRATLEARGFRVLSWIDHTEAGIEWFADLQKQQAGAVASPAPTLGLHLVLGPEFRAMAGNLGRDLQEGRAVLIEAILRRN